jgi:hypothetical protein
MNVSKIHALRVSIYDQAGMIHVNPLSKDFAPTSNGTYSRKPSRRSKDLEDTDFEMELTQAIEQLRKNPIDYHA